MSKKKSTTDQFILQRCDKAPHDSTTGPSSQPQDDTSEKVVPESSSTTDSERTERVGISVSTEDQAGSDPRKEHVALAGPNPEHMDDDFYATAYPDVHENPKLRTDEHVTLETQPSSTEPLSSMKNLEDTDTFGDQFLNDKPTEDEPPINTEATTITTAILEITPFIALQLRVAKLEQDMSEVKKTDHSAIALERHTADLVEKYSVQTAPESSKKQETEKSPKEIIRIKREQGEKKPEPTYTIKSTDKVALKEFDLKGALFNIMHKNKFVNRNPANYRLYHALMESLIEDENAMDKEVTDKVKDHKRKRDSDDDVDDDDEGPSAGSNQGESTKRKRHDSSAFGLAQPPFKDSEQSTKNKLDSNASAAQQPPAHTSSAWQITDTRDTPPGPSMQRSDHQSEQSSDDNPITDERHVSDPDDTDNAHIPKNNWANIYTITYQDPEENKLQRNTGDIGSFIKWFCKRTGKKKLYECHKLLTDEVDLVNPEGHQILRNVYEPLPLGGPPGQDASDFLFKEDYTIVNKPRAVIYRDRDDNKKMMRINEVHKFSDGTLMRIRDKLDFMVKDFRLFKFNKGMETRKWTEDDKRRSEDFIEIVKKSLVVGGGGGGVVGSGMVQVLWRGGTCRGGVGGIHWVARDVVGGAMAKVVGGGVVGCGDGG
ncbi:hypothetical protein Tco_0156031 [Tanacetum coccineum]